MKQEKYIALTAITLPKSKSVSLGSSEYLIPAFTPSNASEQGITWTSSNTSVATVDENGKVTAAACSPFIPGVGRSTWYYVK